MLALKVVVMPAAPHGEAQVAGPRGVAGVLTRLYQLKGSRLSPLTWYVATRCYTPGEGGSLGWRDTPAHQHLGHEVEVLEVVLLHVEHDPAHPSPCQRTGSPASGLPGSGERVQWT